MAKKLLYEPVRVGSMSAPGVAERLTPTEIRQRELARERARMPKKSADPMPSPSSAWGRLSELGKGIERLKGR